MSRNGRSRPTQTKRPQAQPRGAEVDAILGDLHEGGAPAQWPTQSLDRAERRLEGVLAGIAISAAESVSTTMAALRAEDQGWTRPGAQTDPVDYSLYELCTIRKNCRKLWLIDGAIKNAERLLLSGSVGRGILTPKAASPAVQPVVDEFFKDPDNRLAAFSPQAIERMNLGFMLDGEVFIALNTSRADGHVKLSIIPVSEITELVRHPDNPQRVVAYQRTYKPERFDWSTGKRVTNTESVVCYYRDIEAPDLDEPRLGDDPAAAELLAGCPSLVPNVCLFQIRVNTTGLRGVPLVARAVEWARAHHRCVTDMVCYVRALTAIAWIKKARTRSASAFATSAAVGVDSAAGPGGVYTSNDATDISAVNVGGGGRVRSERPSG
jgi:hypothetical protein